MLALTIIQILQVLLGVVRWIIIAQAILSILIAFNVINTHNNFVRSLHYGLDRVTEPLYRPFRRFIPAAGGIDWTPFVVLIIIYILDAIILPNIAMSLLSNRSV
ncbi:osmotic-shock protein [Sphingomonas lenta]|uniref:Osmotic-shock protein n=1 Tax=Sphingomonas lenta TaxID=1141887 RepID=A0A2A2SDG5_9SPHN|nr:osmotic-shock protein [Sphingomonas lenta]